MNEVTTAGRNRLIQREGKRNWAYPDPASPLATKYPRKKWGFMSGATILASLPAADQNLSGAPWTCGVGVTGSGIGPSTYWDDREVDRQFKKHLLEFSSGVDKLITIADTSPNQFDALVSLAFNIGLKNFRTSTVLRNHNAGKFEEASQAFNLFNKAQGKVNKGLVARRKGEAAQYLEGLVYEMADEIPPTPDGESSLVASPINISAGASAATAVAAATGSVMDAFTGREALLLVAVFVVILAGVIIYYRRKQRKDGWS